MNKYTAHKSGSAFTLNHIEGGEALTIEKNHPKFSWVAEQASAKRVITITNTRWSSAQDYFGAYAPKKSVSPAGESKPVTINLIKLDDLNIDESLFIPMKTNTVVDKLMSTDEGFMPGTNLMAAGAPGVGKTTVLLEMLYLIQKNEGKRVLFISAEMNRLDMARYLKRFPHWGQLPILFMSDYTDANPAEVIEQTLNQGWDLVLTDSYTEVNDTVKEECAWSRGKAEKWFLDLMDHHNKGNNALKKYTTFVTILQLSKGGNFVGSNKLKHMTTAMMHIDFYGSENSDQRYIEFSKNRVGQVGKKLFFSMQNGVTFDEARYSRELWADDQLAAEKARLETEEDAFDKIFGKLVSSEEEVPAQEA
jgi:predicted ATP-dependent serine protease